MFELLWPWLLLLLPLPLLPRLLLRGRERRQAALTVPALAPFTLPEKRADHVIRFGTWLPALMLTLAWIALVVALTRPQWTGEPVALPTSGRDLMLAVDISGSMGTADMQLAGQAVNRLTVVKAVVSEFLQAREGDRVGLILFGTNAYLQAPLTFDTRSVGTLLEEAPVGIAGGKTAIGDAIGLAVKRLRQRPAGDRVLILLTDGANNVGEVAPLKAAELAREEGIRIYTIGAGADEMLVQSPFGILGPRVTNPSAELDEDTLTRIAELTDGQYFRARSSDELARIYALIDALEPIEQDPETFRPTTALYMWPLAAAFICLLLTLLIQSQRRTDV